LSDYKFYFT